MIKKTVEKNVFEEILEYLPKKIKATRKRPNASGIDMEYVKRIGGTIKGKTCTLPGLTKTGKPKTNHAIGYITETLTFGKTKSMFKKNAPIIDRIGNTKYPKVYEMLKKIAKIHFPDFPYVDICLNHNFKCIPHKDSNNRGESIIVGFGNYSDGELNVEGAKYNIRHKPFKFDGSQYLHWVEDWDGDRWTAVYFQSKLTEVKKKTYKLKIK